MTCMKDAHNQLKRGNKKSMKQQALTLSVLATYIVFFLKLTNYLTNNAEFPTKWQAVNDSMLPSICYIVFIPALTQP